MYTSGPTNQQGEKKMARQSSGNFGSAQSQKDCNCNC